MEEWNSFTKAKGESVKVNWKSWLYDPGMPPVTLNFETTLSKLTNFLADRYIELDGDPK